jgi:hypothetical protein
MWHKRFKPGRKRKHNRRLLTKCNHLIAVINMQKLALQIAWLAN